MYTQIDCPVCGGKAIMDSKEQEETIYCEDPECNWMGMAFKFVESKEE